MDEEIRTALRPILKREPTRTEMRHLSIAEVALGDQGMQCLQAKNSLEQLKSLRLLKRELLTQMRKNVRRLRRLCSKAQLKSSGAYHLEPSKHLHKHEARTLSPQR